jgi:hypothetical protein
VIRIILKPFGKSIKPTLQKKFKTEVNDACKIDGLFYLLIHSDYVFNCSALVYNVELHFQLTNCAAWGITVSNVTYKI